ncbi:MAG: hypothetical protein AAF206_04345, partial [Bacteroidota bacterium]
MSDRHTCIFLLLGFLIGFPCSMFGQSIPELENKLRQSSGLEKLKTLNQLSRTQMDQGPASQALTYATKAVEVGEIIFSAGPLVRQPEEQVHLVQAYYQLGEAFYHRGMELPARDEFLKTRSRSRRLQSLLRSRRNQLDETIYDRVSDLLDDFEDDASDFLEDIQEDLSAEDLGKRIRINVFNKEKLERVIQSTTEGVKLSAEIMAARINEKNGQLRNAVEHYKNAIEIFEEQGETEEVNELKFKVAVLLDSLQDHSEAKDFLADAIRSVKEVVPKIPETPALPDIPAVDLKIEPFKEKETPKSIAFENVPETSWIPPFDQKSKNKEVLKLNQEDLKDISERYAEEKDFEKSLAYYKLYQELTAKVIQDSLLDQKREGELTMLRQQKEIADLNVTALEREKKAEVRIRNAVILLTALILLSSLVVLYFYLTKRKEHKKLTIAYRSELRVLAKNAVKYSKYCT